MMGPYQKWLLGLAATALLPDAASAERFDLNCAGTGNWDRPDSDHPVQRRLQIDLDAREFCFGGCPEIQRIAGVTAELITLEDGTRDAARPEKVNFSSFNRATGQYLTDYQNFGLIYVRYRITAHCSEEPFTPFPATARRR